MAAIDFNAQEAPDQTAAPSGGSSPMLPGFVIASMVKSEVKDNSNNDGKYVETEWTVLAPDWHKGRKFWHNINYVNKSEKAQAIGQGQLKFLCGVAGVARLADTSKLHNIPVGVDLGIEEERPNPKGGTYPAKNRVSFFEVASKVDPAKYSQAGSYVAPAAPAQAQRTAPPAPWSSAQPPSAPPAAPTPAPAPAPAPADAPAPAPATSAGSAPPWARK